MQEYDSLELEMQLAGDIKIAALKNLAYVPSLGRSLYLRRERASEPSVKIFVKYSSNAQLGLRNDVIRTIRFGESSSLEIKGRYRGTIESKAFSSSRESSSAVKHVSIEL